MIKQLYFSFLIYGFFLWYVMAYLWGFPGPPDRYDYLTVACAIVLSCGASILSIYKPALSAITGGLCLLITAPMFTNIVRAFGFSAGYFTVLVSLALIAYIAGIVYCILILLKRTRFDDLNKKAKIALCILPFVLFILFTIADHFLKLMQ